MRNLWAARFKKVFQNKERGMRGVTILLTISLSTLFTFLLGSSIAVGETETGYIDLVTRVEIDHFHFGRPSDLAADLSHGTLLYLDTANGELHTLDPFGYLLATAPAAVNGGRMTYDSASGSLLMVDPREQTLVAMSLSPNAAPETAVRLPAARVNGLAIDAQTGDLYYLDGRSQQLKRVAADKIDEASRSSAAQKVPVSTHTVARNLGDLRGLAIHPISGNLFSIDRAQSRIVELSTQGDLLKVYDIAPFNLPELFALAFAPSTNQTDEPEVVHLFVASGGDDADIWELSFKPPVSPTLAASPAALVQTINVWQFNPPSPDGSGVTYLSNVNRLMETDSEVNEKSIYEGYNQFEITLNGTLVGNQDTTHFSNEPTGIAYDPDRNHLFLTDDDAGKVNEVDLNYNLVNSFSVTTIAGKGVDPEGITYNTWTGRLYLAGGTSGTIFWIDPGTDGDFGTGDDIEGSFPATSLSDPEGIAFNTTNGNLLVSGKKEVIEYGPLGGIIQVIDIKAANPQKPAGVAFGPSSTGGGNSIYVSDRGLDSDSGVNGGRGDGRIYEFTYGPGSIPNPPTAAFSATPLTGPSPLTVNFNNNSSGSFYSCQWDFGNGGSSSDCGNPAHIYNTPGTYSVSLKVIGAGGADIESKTNYVTVIQPAVAAFSATPTVIFAPDTVVFTNNSSGAYNTCAWDFGDGGSSSSCAPKVAHHYTTTGTHDVSLTVSGAGGLSTDTKASYITVNDPPDTNFSASPTFGPAPLNVTFDNLTTIPMTTCDWDFDVDNLGTSIGTSCAATVNHTYNNAGTYAVALAISNTVTTDVLTKTNYIHVGTPVVANFSETNKSGLTPLAVSFTNTSSGDFDVCHWDFGDGQTSTSCGPAVNHSYSKIGTFSVSLTVTGIGGESVKSKANLVTTNQQAVAEFHAAPTAGIAPQTVLFSNLSSGGFTTCTWNFGDGGSSNNCLNPEHEYINAGTYDVSLTVSGPGGTDAEVKTNHISVAVPVSADFSGTPISGTAPLDASFTNLSTGDFNSCFWEFGDGKTSFGCANQNHQYLTGGIFSVSLTASGPGGSEMVTKQDMITVYQPNTARFSAAPLQGIAPFQVNYTNLSTGNYDTCQWDFGDGGQSNLCSDPAHTYVTSGIYAVSLAIDGLGGPSTVISPSLITVFDPVVADFSGTPTTGIAPYAVDFTNLSSGDFLHCNWDFGDGGSSTDCYNINHNYTSPGTYTVALNVQGQGGTITKTLTNYITVNEATVDFSATPRTGNVPLSVTFENLSNGHFDSCEWDFGDGQTSTQCSSPSHTYTDTGVYTVNLTMNGASGLKSVQKNNYITVGSYLTYLPYIKAKKN